MNADAPIDVLRIVHEEQRVRLARHAQHGGSDSVRDGGGEATRRT